MHNPILKTKFQPPSLPNDFIPRHELIGHVIANISRPLILVSADSGSGKSLFMSSLLPEVSFPWGWVSLDPGDNDLRSFLTYFITAIREKTPAFGKQTFVYLTAPQLPAVEDITLSLINDLNNLSGNFLLVLDDLHLITDPDIHKVLSAMLEFPPPQLHLALITRITPPLPLERLRARNKLTEIGASQLRLSRDEIRMFVEKNIGKGDTEPLVDLLAEKTEGWVTGLRLAMLHLSFRKENPLENIHNLREANLSENYFMDEVLENLDPEITEFLLKTSVLEKFSPALTDYLLDKPGSKTHSGEIIGKVRQMNLFVMNLDNTGKWFRYHHLFQEFLRKELAARYSVQEITLLHQRAVDWYEANRFLEETFYHVLQIGDYERMADLIVEYMDIPLNEDKWYLLDEWLSRIPDELIHQRPGLLVASMWVMHNKATWVIPEMLKELDKLGKTVDLDNEIRVQIRFFQGVIQFWSIRLEESLKSFAYVRKNLPKDKVGAIGVNTYYYLLASHMNGVGEQAVKEIERLLLNESLDPFYRVMLIGAVAYVRMMEGNLYEVEELSRRIADLARQIGDNSLTVWAANLLGMVYYYQNRLQEAEEQFAITMSNVYILNLLGPMDCFAGDLLTLRALGKKKKFNRVYEEMNDYIRQRNNPAMDTFMNSFNMRLAVLDGDTEKAGRYLNHINMFFETGNLFFWMETPRVTNLKYLLALYDPEKTAEAVRKGGEILALSRKTRNVPQMIQILGILAVARKRTGDPEGALQWVREAIEKAAPGEWIRPFYECGEEMRSLLQEVSLSDAPGKFRDRILQDMPRPVDTNMAGREKEGFYNNAGEVADPGYLLTNRELDVLDLLARRLSNKEIANELFISVATVKRHAITIYRKLKVNKRREAILKAEQLGILPPQEPKEKE